MTRLHIVIYGTVQGVGFRYFVERAARATGVAAGWVRNRRDGAVELEAEGETEALERFREVVARGPAHARVDRLEQPVASSNALPRPFAIVR
jgi:acylphosphatase